MILTVDIGNTSITCGVFDDSLLVKRFCLTSDTDLSVQEYGNLFFAEVKDISIDGAIISSVVNELNSRIQYAILAQFGVKPHILSSESNLPIKLVLEDNSGLGSDRIANAVKAYDLYRQNVIVVDFGTATTFDIVNQNGEFVGGIIAPGVNTQLNSLYSSTSKLPKLEVDTVEKAIGNNTESAILSGVVRGTACMVEGMITQCKKELEGDVVLVATGGLAPYIVKYMTTRFDMISPNLTLEGLRILFDSNKPIQPLYK